MPKDKLANKCPSEQFFLSDNQIRRFIALLGTWNRSNLSHLGYPQIRYKCPKTLINFRETVFAPKCPSGCRQQLFQNWTVDCRKAFFFKSKKYFWQEMQSNEAPENVQKPLNSSTAIFQYLIMYCLELGFANSRDFFIPGNPRIARTRKKFPGILGIPRY